MKRVRFLAMIELMAVLALGLAAPAQTLPQGASKPAANAWMLIPTSYLEWNKDIPPSLRAERDIFWDGLSHRELPLTAKAQRGGAFGGSDWFDDGKEPEIPSVPNRTILIATFTAHRSVLSASEKSIYTEITMRVDQVFEDKTGSAQLAPHRDITLMLTGGAVALRSGQTLTDHARPSDSLIEPQRSYLLVLQYHKLGDWYELTEDWDVTDGVVRANTRRSEYLAKHGRSQINGLAVDELGPALSKELYANN